MSHRQGRINEEMTRELSSVLREIKDPRVSQAMVSVTACEVSPDLKYAKAFYSYIGKAEEKEIEAGLKSAAGFIRKQIAVRLDLRQTPEIRFVRDSSISYGAHINDLLKKIGASSPEKTGETSEKAEEDEK